MSFVPLQTLLLGLRYEELSWDYGRPSIDDPECLPCIFLEVSFFQFPMYFYKIWFFSQFDAIENGINVTKLIQVFTRQADMIDALIAHFTDQRRRKNENNDVNQAPIDPPIIEEGDEGKFSL